VPAVGRKELQGATRIIHDNRVAGENEQTAHSLELARSLTLPRQGPYMPAGCIEQPQFVAPRIGNHDGTVGQPGSAGDVVELVGWPGLVPDLEDGRRRYSPPGRGRPDRLAVVGDSDPCAVAGDQSASRLRSHGAACPEQHTDDTEADERQTHCHPRLKKQFWANAKRQRCSRTLVFRNMPLFGSWPRPA
jgi:hypothetical protein